MSKHVNLIPAKTLSVIRSRKATAKWKRVLLLGATVSVLMTGWLRGIAIERTSLLKQESTRASIPREIADEGRRLTQTLSRTIQSSQRQEMLRSGHSPLGVFALLTEIKQSLQGELHVELVDYALNIPAAQTHRIPEAKGGQLLLQVVASNTANSSQVIEMLKESGYFREVKLNTSLAKLNRDLPDLRFTVACTF